jgi:hypothetical protein
MEGQRPRSETPVSDGGERRWVWLSEPLSLGWLAAAAVGTSRVLCKEPLSQ